MLYLSWRDLGLLKSSFNLGSAQILDTYIQSGNLTPVDLNKQVKSSLIYLCLSFTCCAGTPEDSKPSLGTGLGIKIF